MMMSGTRPLESALAFQPTIDAASMPNAWSGPLPDRYHAIE